MQTLKIDDKFSIEYDETSNDSPKYVLRNGQRHANIGSDTPNWIISMFYALREQEEQAEKVIEANQKITEHEQDMRDRGYMG